MHDIFSWSALSLFALFSMLGLSFYLLGHLCLRFFARQAAADALSIPVGAFIGTVATTWALSLGFLAADVWSINSLAGQAASAERSSISRLEGIARPEALNAPELLAGLSAYRQAVSRVEWATGLNRFPSDQVEAALQHLRVSIITLAKGNVPTSVMGQIVRTFDELQDARNTRLALGSGSIDRYKWYLVLALTILTLLGTSAIHADRPRAGNKALAIYSLTAATSLWILAIHASPYAGAEHISPQSLRQHQDPG